MSLARAIQFGEPVRYAHTSNYEALLDDALNFLYLQRDPEREHKRIILESGINASAPFRGPDGARRPVIALRSSPHRAGSEFTPWHDELDLDRGHVRYYGDHKVTTVGPVGVTKGNKALLEAHQLHQSPHEHDRHLAPPLLLFIAGPQEVNGEIRHSGYLRFAGLAYIERLEFIVQRDPKTGGSFPNLAVDLNLVQLDANDEFDFRWIDHRRRAELSAPDSNRMAPDSWRTWIAKGNAAGQRIRRRVQSSRVRSRDDQLPVPGSRSAEILDRIYHRFDTNKHAFEELAARVASHVMGEREGRYTTGWLTRSGGDGGLDFIGRLDVGFGDGAAPLVILGQAKCVKPTSGISPDQVARLVARLRRGWVGVFVTTGHFSKQAQVEIVEDEYPVVLVAGRRLAEVVHQIVEESFDGNLDGLLDDVLATYATSVTYRRPQEILGA